MYSTSTRAVRQLAVRTSASRGFLALPVRRLLSIPSSQPASSLLSVNGLANQSRFAVGGIRKYSVLSEETPATLYDYKGIKDIVSNPAAHPDSVVIDVREPVEFQDGHIPSAINLPFKTSPGALGLSEEDFLDQFGFDKPAADKELIFYCLAGVRSSAAEDLARTFGYKNRGNYIGSYEDWLTHENATK